MQVVDINSRIEWQTVQIQISSLLQKDHWFWLCRGLTTLQRLWVILCRLPEKGRREIEEIVEMMKEGGGGGGGKGERGKWMKVKKQKKSKHSPSTLTCCKDSRPCPIVSQYQLDAPLTQDTRHLCLTQPPIGRTSRTALISMCDTLITVYVHCLRCFIS